MTSPLPRLMLLSPPCSAAADREGCGERPECAVHPDLTPFRILKTLQSIATGFLQVIFIHRFGYLDKFLSAAVCSRSVARTGGMRPPTQSCRARFPASPQPSPGGYHARPPCRASGPAASALPALAKHPARGPCRRGPSRHSQGATQSVRHVCGAARMPPVWTSFVKLAATGPAVAARRSHRGNPLTEKENASAPPVDRDSAKAPWCAQSNWRARAAAAVRGVVASWHRDAPGTIRSCSATPVAIAAQLLQRHDPVVRARPTIYHICHRGAGTVCAAAAQPAGRL